MDSLARVREQLDRYEHLLLAFEAHPNSRGGVDLHIRLRHPIPGAHDYLAPIHARDIAHPQFPWTFQKFLYDCMHDYLCELFERNPQQKANGA